MKTNPRFLRAAVFGLALPLLVQGCGGSSDAAIADGTKIQVAVLATTDLHTNVLSYDYYRLSEDKSVGMARLATLIKKARTEFKNTVLLDNGDTIQGTALADQQALVSPIACSQTLAVYKVMNSLGYDGGGIGNHEFNYGLPFLNQVTGSHFDVAGVQAGPRCAGPDFPLVLANVTSAKTGAPLFAPYRIVSKTFTAAGPDGSPVQVPLKVGIIGFTPSPIMAWDKRWLDGKVTAQGVVEAAQRYLPEVRAQGADLVIALAHGGLDNGAYAPDMENGNWHLAKVPGIDAMLLGHSHQVFPNATSTVAQFNLPGVDKGKGTVHGVPAVMAGFWGKNLGVIKLSLTYAKGKWSVDQAATAVEVRAIQNPDKTYVDADPAVANMVAAEHAATIDYVKTPIGTTDFRMNTYFADVGEVSAIQVVNQAQARYVADYVAATLPQYASLPVLSVSAPFKSGFGGGSDYTDVAAGNVAINNAADLYLYPNTVYAVKVTGADVKTWLETAAKRFNQIDPAQAADQMLVSSFPGYNFDMFTSPDLAYEIDVTRPVGERIRALAYKGTPINPQAEFIVATNNYRASGGGNFPGLDGSKTIYAAPDANRDVLIGYIKAAHDLARVANGSARSWRFTKVAVAGRVLFKSGSGKLALAQAAGIDNVSVVSDDDGSGKGLGIYAIDLNR